MNFETLFEGLDAIPILDPTIPLLKYCPIDLSVGNAELEDKTIGDPEVCQNYVDKVLNRNNALVAYGGYLEKRGLYSESERFSEGKTRNIHLGMDFWCKAGTKVIVPLDGELHSFENNADVGNYGPTIILKHQIKDIVFHTLYGHLSLESIQDLYDGMVFSRGDVLGTLGTTDINVNYAPHLHFQIIRDLGDYYGDYPGVCHQDDLSYYQKNCPNPNFIFKL